MKIENAIILINRNLTTGMMFIINILKSDMFLKKTVIICFFLMLINIPFIKASNNPQCNLEVIPLPREIKYTETVFDAHSTKYIIVSDNTSDRFAAHLLQEALRGTHGINGQVIPVLQESSNTHQLWLGLDKISLNCSELPALLKKEGYKLEVKNNGVLISAEGNTGLFYGVQTLIQLLEQSQREKAGIKGVVLTDWPTFEWRGRYLEGGQSMGTVINTRENIEREIILLSRSKLNFLYIEIYNLAPFQSFPASTDANTLSLTDWKYLIELAHQYHVTLIPGFQSFAQVYQIIWTCDEGKPYREETAPGLICPSRPENIKFLQGIYRDLISLFKYSPILGIGCSEVGMQWQKNYCPRCQKRIDNGETLQDIYFKHVRACIGAVEEAAKGAGRAVRPLMWADEFYCGYDNKRWVGIENIPTNTIMGHWQYWSLYQNMPSYMNKEYDGISGLMERGFDVFFLSANFQYDTYLMDLSPRIPSDGKWDVMYDSGIENIADQPRWAEIYGNKNLLGKMLGGGCATFSQHDIRCWDTMWFSYYLHAEYTWGDPKRPLYSELNDFIKRFSSVFYGARDQQSANSIAKSWKVLDDAKNDIERNNYLIRDILGEYDIHDNSYNGNSLEASLNLLDELDVKPNIAGKTINDIRLRAESVVRVSSESQRDLSTCLSKTQNTTSLNYLILAAHKMENHAKRTLLLTDLSTAFRKWKSTKNLDDKIKLKNEFSLLQKRLDELIRDTQVITDEMDKLAYGEAFQLIWGTTDNEKATVSKTTDTTGYHIALESLNAFRKQIDNILTN